MTSPDSRNFQRNLWEVQAESVDQPNLADEIEDLFGQAFEGDVKVQRDTDGQNPNDDRSGEVVRVIIDLSDDLPDSQAS